MPIVPIIDRQTVNPEAMPNVRVPIDAPAAAFGGGASAERLNAAVQGVGSAVADIGENEKKKADTVAYLDASTKLSAAQTQIQLATSKMLGKDALGAPDYAEKAWQDAVSKVTDGLSNDTQRLAVLRDATNRREELNRAVQTHVSGQTRAMAEETTKSFLDSSRAAATLNAYDDNRVGTEIQRQTAVVQDWAQRNGVPQDSEIYKARLQDELSATHKAVIDARLNAGQDEAAQTYFEAHKDGLSAPDLLRTTQQLQASKNLAVSQDLWSKVQGYKLSDGSPDEAKMQSAVMSAPGLSEQQKMHALDFVQAQAKIAYYNKQRQDSANEREFLNQVLQARKDGQPLDQALKLVNGFARDNEDTALMTRQAQQVYAPAAYKSDVEKVLTFHDGIQQGTVSQSDLRDGLAKQWLNVEDYKSLSEDLQRKNAQADSADEKNAWEKVKALADQNFGMSSTQDKLDYLNTVRTLTAGKTSDQVWQTAQDELKNDPRASGWFSSTQQWKSDMQKMQLDSTAMGKLTNDLGGKNVVSAISQAIALRKATAGAGPGYPNAKSGYSDFDSFAKEFGGYDAIKSGTPVNNAIRSLQKHGLYAVPENIRWVLKNHPDGVY